MRLAAHNRHVRGCGRRGAALLVAIFVMAVSLLLVLAFLDAASVNQQLVSTSEHYVEALYIARAGMEHAIASYRADPTAALPRGHGAEFPAGSGHQFNWTCAPGSGLSTIRITATGEATGITRTVVAEVQWVDEQAVVQSYSEQ